MFYWSYSLVWPIVPLFQYDKPRPVEKPDSTFKKVYKKQYVVIFYGIIILHDIPYLIAKKRNHPHADAIHVAGWVSLFTLHVIWPFLWIWATLYRPERGWGMQNHDSSVVQLQQRIAGLEKQLADIKSSSAE